MSEFKLPDVGEGLTEAEIVAWHVKVGDTVKINDIVCEIETAKSVVELPSPYAGVVAALLVPEGETVAVGTPIIAIGDPAEKSPAPAEESPVPAETAANPAETSGNPAETSGNEDQPLTLVGSGPKEGALVRRPRKVPSGAQAAHMQTQAAFEPGLPSPHVEAANGDSVATSDVSGGVSDSSAGTGDLASGTGDLSGAAVVALAKPPVRKLAKDLGVDLRTLTPSRPDGVITRAEVEAAAAGRQAAPAEGTGAVPAPAVVTSGGRERREPIRGVRKMMGQAMVESAFTLPHVSIWKTVDVTATIALVERLKGHRDFRDRRVSPLLVVAKACLLALRRTPIVNSVWDDAAQEIVFKEYVNLGIAAATPRGLVVPNVKGADAMSLADLAGALGELVATARDGKTPPADLAGGTFTITNVGPFGMEAGTPIINPGESAILCFGAIERRPWVVGTGADERIVPRDVCTLALSFDHRHIDGAAGSRFLADVADVLEDPATALLF
ncbi:dihydrolipoamide acetyltransferase family protein [Nocardioides sp. DS6]|uniref:Dihydrolipoamide acetyltransferase component of pyruvate dehydrogenase complex n=1 Tax=Nocardioides eburneus TaxID=3231482 RepID=A0ABV3SU91_9ACTN